ncbi:MAG: nucleoside kinase [Bacteroidales bacterium]|nr:nucleoside kinase [Bacteroidales bacterium]
MQTVPIYCKNTNSLVYAPFGQKLYDFLQEHQMLPEVPYLGALVNNKVRDLSYQIHRPSIIDFFDYYSTAGRGFYVRSLYLLLCKTVHDLFPMKVKLRIKHSISGGRFCTLENMDEPITEELVQKMFNHMKKIVRLNIPFERVEMLTEDAIRAFQEYGLEDKYELLKDRNRIFTSVYRLDTTINYYYGFMVPSTGYLQLFGLEMYENGILLKIPSAKNIKVLPKTHANPKLFSQYKLSKDWSEFMGMATVTDMNRIIGEGRALETILVAEAFQEKWISKVADDIHRQKDVKMVLISGPSSSGKTTTCRRLSVQLAVLGYKPVQISVDDFFVERDETPVDEKGEKDFEALEAIDLPLFNDTLKRLVAGECVEIPTFDFTKGSKIWTGKTLQLEENSIMVVEGIHCLNPKLTEQVPDDLKFKIFVSALTSISIDRQNPIPTTDNRLIRRIVRDYNYRGYSALDTLRRWQSVRNGEDKNIFPFQENADVMINTSLIFELGILKNYAIPILQEVPETVPEYAEARRLLKFLSFFHSISVNDIPGTSILREFVGGSKFQY